MSVHPQSGIPLADSAARSELYEHTMARLGRMGLDKNIPSRDHILQLADEIEGYRKHIAEMNSLIHHLEAEARATKNNPAPAPAEALENQRLKDAIVAQFLAQYALNGR